MLLLSHVALGTVAGEWQAVRKTPPTGNCGCGGWVSRMDCRAGASSPGFIKGKKMKSREMDLPSTIRVVAHSVFVCATERNAYILNICTICTVFIQ